jgi:opacity protein-like surface antigen
MLGDPMNRRALCLVLALPLLTASLSAQSRPSVMVAGGTLISVDEDTATLQVQQGAHQQTYTMTKAPELTQGKKRLDVSGLSKLTGYQVTVRYKKSDGQRIADRVRVSERKASGGQTASEGGGV